MHNAFVKAGMAREYYGKGGGSDLNDVTKITGEKDAEGNPKPAKDRFDRRRRAAQGTHVDDVPKGTLRNRYLELCITVMVPAADEDGYLTESARRWPLKIRL